MRFLTALMLALAVVAGVVAVVAIHVAVVVWTDADAAAKWSAVAAIDLSLSTGLACIWSAMKGAQR